jgi:hypothetical protein
VSASHPPSGFETKGAPETPRDAVVVALAAITPANPKLRVPLNHWEHFRPGQRTLPHLLMAGA